MSSAFEFKQFSLDQGKSAFKLGTDSVVLGSWIPANNFQRVLDIGSGTGILALMMAQRFNQADILAIELDPDSAVDALANFQRSKWDHRLSLVNMNIMDWSKQNPNEKFDLIISNPPYFKNSLKNPDARKTLARHTDSLSFNDLSEMASVHLQPDGIFATILPVSQFNELEILLKKFDLYPQHICTISSYEKSSPIRKMGLFRFTYSEIKAEVQFLYNDDKSRSFWYKSISGDFYIK